MPGLQVINNAQIDKYQQQELAKLSTPEVVLSLLATHVRDVWQRNKNAKADIEPKLNSALRARKGEYSETELANIRSTGGSEIYMMLVDEKCTAVEDWLTDLLLGPDSAWGLDKTPIPDISDEEKQQIAERLMAQYQTDIQSGMIAPTEMQNYIEEVESEFKKAIEEHATEEIKKLEEAINDILVEGKFKDALGQVISDIVTFPAGILKGPIVRKKISTEWVDGAIQLTDQFVIEFDRVSPFNYYPAPGACFPGDGPEIERHRITRSGLASMKGVDGYDPKAIDDILTRAGNGELSSWLEEVATEQTADNSITQKSDKIDALQFWGDVQGLKLIEWGIDVPDPLAEYRAEVWLIKDKVIKATICTDHQSIYYATSYRKRNGTIWGSGVPDLIGDIGGLCNSAARNLVNNMAICSGPQAVIDLAALPDGEDVTNIRPWRVWQINTKSAPQSKGLSFFTPPNAINELLKTYEFFSSEADNKAGIPRFSYGQQGGGGALGTATGTSIMMNNATRGIKGIVRNIDTGVVEPSLAELYRWCLKYAPEKLGDYAGDAKIVAKGSKTLINKEQTAVRKNELLGIVLNPAVLQIIGPAGLSEVLRSVFDGLDMDVNKIIPDRLGTERMLFQQSQQQIAQQGQPQGNNVSQDVLPSGQRTGDYSTA